MLPSVAALASYGGALNDYSPVVDSTTDRPATGTNPAYADTAAMTHTAIRAWVELTLSASTPLLVAWDATWKGNASNAAPAPARTGTGVNTITFPATILDEILAGSPGYMAAGWTLNLRAGWGNDRAGSAALWEVRVVPTAANVLTVYTWTGGALADMGSLNVDVFAI